MTGWILRTFCVWFSGPTLNVVLFWNGRLIMSAIGFCAALANASVSSASAAPDTANRPAARITIQSERFRMCSLLASRFVGHGRSAFRRYGSNAKIRFQSFFMLMTVHFFAFASAIKASLKVPIVDSAP